MTNYEMPSSTSDDEVVKVLVLGASAGEMQRWLDSGCDVDDTRLRDPKTAFGHVAVASLVPTVEG